MITIANKKIQFAPTLPNILDIEDIDCIIDPDKNSGIGGLYLSNLKAAQNQFILKKFNIKAILSTNINHGLRYDKSVVESHKSVEAIDRQFYDLSKHYEESISFIKKQIRDKNVLVHCQAGCSRSASIVIAYLMASKDWDLEYALQHVKLRRPIIYPNPAFIKQLENFQQKLSQDRQINSEFYTERVQKVKDNQMSILDQLVIDEGVRQDSARIQSENVLASQNKFKDIIQNMSSKMESSKNLVQPKKLDMVQKSPKKDISISLQNLSLNKFEVDKIQKPISKFPFQKHMKIDLENLQHQNNNNIKNNNPISTPNINTNSILSSNNISNNVVKQQQVVSTVNINLNGGNSVKPVRSTHSISPSPNPQAKHKRYEISSIMKSQQNLEGTGKLNSTVMKQQFENFNKTVNQNSLKSSQNPNFLTQYQNYNSVSNKTQKTVIPEKEQRGVQTTRYLNSCKNLNFNSEYLTTQTQYQSNQVKSNNNLISTTIHNNNNAKNSRHSFNVSYSRDSNLKTSDIQRSSWYSQNRAQSPNTSKYLSSNKKSSVIVQQQKSFDTPKFSNSSNKKMNISQENSTMYNSGLQNQNKQLQLQKGKDVKELEAEQINLVDNKYYRQFRFFKNNNQNNINFQLN